MRLFAPPLARARISASLIESPFGSAQSRGAFMVAHCQSAPPGSGDGASPPPSDADGAGQSFQASFWADRSWSAEPESSLTPVIRDDSRRAVAVRTAARGRKGAGM